MRWSCNASIHESDLIVRRVEEYVWPSGIKLGFDEPHFAPSAIPSTSAWLPWSTVSASYDDIAMTALLHSGIMRHGQVRYSSGSPRHWTDQSKRLPTRRLACELSMFYRASLTHAFATSNNTFCLLPHLGGRMAVNSHSQSSLSRIHPFKHHQTTHQHLPTQPPYHQSHQVSTAQPPYTEPVLRSDQTSSAPLRARSYQPRRC